MNIARTALSAVVTLASLSVTTVALANTSPQPCTAHSLKVTIRESGVAAGSTFYRLRYRNTTGAACTLYGWPGVSLAHAGGAQIGQAASRDRSAVPSSVLLLPGHSAHSGLQVASAQNYPPAACHPVTARRLKVYPPGSLTPVLLRFRVAACSKALASGSQASVTAVTR
jgi:Protein of unknown function (DUF4232)